MVVFLYVHFPERYDREFPLGAHHHDSIAGQHLSFCD